MNAYNDHARMQSDELSYSHPVNQSSSVKGHDTNGPKLKLELRDSEIDLPPLSPDAELSLEVLTGNGRVGDAHAALTSQSLNTDGTPKRPMNAFMIFARRRRPQVSAANQMMRTGEISKLLSKEWQAMTSSDKQFYLDQAKKLKENFNSRYPDYVYKRRPNNSRKRRRTSGDALHHRQGGDGDEGSPDHDDQSLDANDHATRALRSPEALVTHHPGFSDSHEGPFSSHNAQRGFPPVDVMPRTAQSHPQSLSSYPDHFNHLSWPPISHGGQSNHSPGSLGSTAHHRVGSLAMSPADLSVESPTWNGNPPPRLDPLKIDTTRPAHPSHWYLQGAHTDSPIASQTSSHRSAKSETSHTPQHVPRPWSASTSSTSSDNANSQPPVPTSKTNPFDVSPGDIYGSPTSAHTQLHNTAHYFPPGSGGLLHSRLGSDTYDSPFGNPHSPPLSASSATGPNYIPTLSSRSSGPYDPLSPAPRSHVLPPMDPYMHSQFAGHQHGSSTSHPSDEPSSTAIGTQNYWSGKSETP